MSSMKSDILGCFIEYYKQIEYNFDAKINEIVNKNTEFCDLFSSAFDEKFNPAKKDRNHDQLIEKLTEIGKKDSDSQIFLTLIKILNFTVRTNVYKNSFSSFAIKLKPNNSIENFPAPLPFAEIFVYNEDFEGTHIRADKIARGGFRLSDRFDYRTEALGLVKAQTVKNAIIVPSGAKACIYVKNKEKNSLEFSKECYCKFVSCLLELTDNIIDGKIISPENVVKYDNEDPYIVAAADKGTASFSDTANELSKKYNFWLKDAFASGGSNGYSHKDLAITSTGVYNSISNSFFEIGMNIENELTCIGIGDMSGDLFGNGMRLFKKIKLLAAFNHKHIFIDPTPDIEKARNARNKLFENPKLTWSDYDKSAISIGGGIFDRFGGNIKLTSEMHEVFGIDRSIKDIEPEKLINILLKMNVDVIYNGGIGTFVKSEEQTHDDVKDKFNDNIRVNGSEVRAKVFAEGGNLGVTQSGRIEMSRSGVKVNMDSIDNSAGVCASDLEVNIKIALSGIKIEESERKSVIKEMSGDVVKLASRENGLQSKLISILSAYRNDKIDLYINLLHTLEKAGIANRENQHLPSDSALLERKKISRASISTIISQLKILVKKNILQEFVSDEYLEKNILFAYFPNAIRQDKYKSGIENHLVKNEIIATKIASDIVDFFGFNFVDKLSHISTKKLIYIYCVLRDVFNLCENMEDLYNDKSISFEQQANIALKVQDLCTTTAIFLSKYIDETKSISENIKNFKIKYSSLTSLLKNSCCGGGKSGCCFDGRFLEMFNAVKSSYLIFIAQELINNKTETEFDVAISNAKSVINCKVKAVIGASVVYIADNFDGNANKLFQLIEKFANSANAGQLLVSDYFYDLAIDIKQNDRKLKSIDEVLQFFL